MCAQYWIDKADLEDVIKEIEEKQAENEQLSFLKTGLIRPTDTAPVYAVGRAGIVPVPMKFGFPPLQAKGAPRINARADTAFSLEMWKTPLLKRRVAAPTSGFFEWKHREGKSTGERYLFTRSDRKTLYLCGMYSVFTTDEGKKEVRFTVLTTEPNDSIAEYHNRMPLLLDPEERDRWLLDEEYIKEVIYRPQPALTATYNPAETAKKKGAVQVSLFGASYR